MQFNWEDTGTLKKKLSVEVPVDAVTKRMEKVFKKLRNQAKFKGFRPGKAPLSMVKKAYGTQVEQEVTQDLIQEAIPEALKEAELKLASPPNLEDSDFKEGEPYKFTLSMELKPEVVIEGYEGLDLERYIVEITDEKVDEQLEQMRQSYASIKSIEESRPADKGDIVVVDYAGFEGDEALEDVKAPNYQVEVGSGFFHEDFESEIVGMSKDDDKTITVTFPEKHFNPAMAGKEIRFEVKLLDIKEKILPELDDDFAKELGDETIQTFEDLKNRIIENITTQEKQRSDEKLRGQLRDKLLDLTEMEVPESMVNGQIDFMLSNMKYNFQRSGMSFDAAGMDDNKLKEEYRPEAEKQVKTNLILEKIAQEKEIEVSESDLYNHLGDMAASMGQPIEKIMEIYQENQMMASMSQEMVMEKTLNYLLENANIQDTDAPVETDDGQTTDAPVETEEDGATDEAAETDRNGADDEPENDSDK